MSRSTELATLIQGFRLYCLAEGRRPSTIRWYMGKLRIFLQWLEDNHVPLDAELLRVDHLRSFMAYLREGHLVESPASLFHLPRSGSFPTLGQGTFQERPANRLKVRLV